MIACKVDAARERKMQQCLHCALFMTQRKQMVCLNKMHTSFQMRQASQLVCITPHDQGSDGVSRWISRTCRLGVR